MEVHMSNITFGTSEHKLKDELAKVLHGPFFLAPGDVRFNFEVHLKPQRRTGPWRTASLTLPQVGKAEYFLCLFGEPNPRLFLSLGTSMSVRVKFEKSRRNPRRDTLERVRRLPYEEPQEAHARERQAEASQAFHVQLATVQFGWECRDEVYSIEHEKIGHSLLVFDEDRREFRIKIQDPVAGDTRIIAIRVSQIAWVSASIHQPSNTPCIFFSLEYPPSFESEPLFTSIPTPFGYANSTPRRQRWSYIDKEHEPIAPFTSLAIRLECVSSAALHAFRKFSTVAHINVSDFSYPVERRGCFSEVWRNEYDLWMRSLPWIVAFHVEALLRSWLVDMMEVMALREPIERVLRSKKGDYTAALLRDFAVHAKTMFWYGEDYSQPHDRAASQDRHTFSATTTVTEIFAQVLARFVYKPLDSALTLDDPTAPFNCYHLIVTPSTTRLEGPYTERSNRVMRKYYQNQDSFLRVSFQDENRLQLRFDRDVDGRSFIDRRVKRILLDGTTIASAHFEFLAYSQSALKEHAVWFVKRFRHQYSNGYRQLVDAASIIESLGDFRTLDPKLMYCPARYAARISQAFTATDASVSAGVGQIMHQPDVQDASGEYCFTDGVGTLSPLLAQEIWKALRRGKRGRKYKTYPRAYQIRFQGSKGMLSVDHTLPDRAIVLRPSMIKFEDPKSMSIDIARSFDRPGAYYLNRPLIMLLEGLGVSYEVFKELQDEAVLDAKKSVDSLAWSARLLEAHGLGVSFRLTSTMLGLHKLDLEPPHDDIFWRQMMDFAVNHVLRELKHHARIPVRGTDSWTLVGVADVHKYLQESEVFVCVDSPNESGLIYLEGPVLVSRSPTIHPGDVQIVNAIGRPPVGSPFARESLRNTIVFSIQGQRPLPSYLGGGDLDGDVYNVTTRPDLLPQRTYYPASYTPSPRKLVDHESTMADVADFVAEYISSDTLGIIAINWLIIADQSDAGIMDPDCLKLAGLHSNAVDYPKTGQPVPLEQIPKLKFKTKPDWNAPETISKDNPSYYQSGRAIGKLFRAIDLPAVRKVDRAVRFQRRHMRDIDQEEQMADMLDEFSKEQPYEIGSVPARIEERVAEFIDDVDQYDEKTITELWELYGSYAAQLRAISADHALSPSRSAMLTEEEVVIGTIVAKSSQPRRRKDLMSQLRENTATLVSGVRDQIAGDDDVPPQESLRRAWIAYRLANLDGDIFGARSFGWLSLSNIFDAIREIEEEEHTPLRRWDLL